jgi:hypothetical protein
LLAAGTIDEGQLETALKEQQQWGGRLGQIMVNLRMVSEEDMVRAVSSQLGLPATTLGGPIQPEVLDTLSVDYCEKQQVIPVKLEGAYLSVAMADPGNLTIVDEIQYQTRLKVRPLVAAPSAVQRAIDRHYKQLQENPNAAPFNMGGSRLIDFDRKTVPPAKPDGKAETKREKSSSRGASRAPRSKTMMPGGAAELKRMEERIVELEGMLSRDEVVLRRVLGVLVDSGLVTREQILTWFEGGE